MRLIVDCDCARQHDDVEAMRCQGNTLTTPDEILAALAEAGVLKSVRWSELFDGRPRQLEDGSWSRADSVRYVSPWTSVNPRDARTGNLEGS